MTVKTPIRTVFSGATAVGLSEFQSGEFIGVENGGIGTTTLTANSILLGNGTNALQSSSIQIVGTTLSSSDSSTININEGLVVEGNLTVTGSITGTIANASLTNSSFTLADDTSSTTTISLGETLKIAGGSGVDTTISGDTITIALESTVVTETSTDTLTNKSISLSTNTLTGTLAEFNTAVSNADLASLAGTETLTNKTISGSSNTLTNIDNSSLTNSSFTLTDDSSSTTTISLGETLKIAGGSGVDTTLSGDTITISLESNIVTETSSDTLTNKSISLTTNTITGTLAEFNSALSGDNFVSLTGTETLTNKTLTAPVISSITNTGTLTLPISTDTLVGRATTDTLTNKTLTSPVISTISNSGTLTLPTSTDTLIGRATTDTLTNKTISGSSNTLTNIANTSLTNSSFTLADDTSSTTTISLGETLKISGTSNEIETTISGDTITIGLPNNVTIGSNLTVGGDLTVNGTTTTINSTTLTVDDKNIELASVATPTDVTADGAGITIKGTTDKTFNWLDATDSFTSSEHIDLASTKVFKINNSTVLSSTQVLGKSVPSGTIVGTSDSQTLTNKTISGSDNTLSNIANSSLTNSSFTIVDDTSTTSTISLGEALLLAGGTGITSVITGDTVTFNIDSTVTTLTGTQTLTNKTLTTPIISSISNSGTITLPTSTDTLVGRATTDTLTNKTLTSPKINEDVVVTATATELNFTDGVTSNIQTQLDAKASRAFAIAQAVALG